VAGVAIRRELRPGDLGAMIEQHGRLYAEEFGFDARFEAYVAKGLAHAFLEPVRARPVLWFLVDSGARVAGSLVVAPVDTATAQLRYVLLEPEVRGRGLGRRLLTDAITAAHDQGYRRMFLMTVDVCRGAASLYRRAGFELTHEEAPAKPWGRTVREQRYDLAL
jgi:GNAT superfamily N-acetyltransferase